MHRYHDRLRIPSAPLLPGWEEQRAKDFQYAPAKDQRAQTLQPGEALYCQLVNVKFFREFLSHLCIETFSSSLPPLLDASLYALSYTDFQCTHEGDITTLRIALIPRNRNDKNFRSLLSERDSPTLHFLLPFLAQIAKPRQESHEPSPQDPNSAFLHLQFPSVYIDELISEIQRVKAHISESLYEPVQVAGLFPLDSNLIRDILAKHVPLIGYQSFDAVALTVFVYKSIASHVLAKGRFQFKPEKLPKVDSTIPQDFNPASLYPSNIKNTLQTSVASFKSTLAFERPSSERHLWSFPTLAKLKVVRRALHSYILSNGMNDSSRHAKPPYSFDVVPIAHEMSQKDALTYQFGKNSRQFKACFKEISFDGKGIVDEKALPSMFISARCWRGAQQACFLDSMLLPSTFTPSRHIQVRENTFRCACLLLDDFMKLVTREYLPFNRIATNIRRIWADRLGRASTRHVKHCVIRAVDVENNAVDIQHHDIAEIIRLLDIRSTEVDNDRLSDTEEGCNIAAQIQSDCDLLDILFRCLGDVGESSASKGGACLIEVRRVHLFVGPSKLQILPEKSTDSLRLSEENSLESQSVQQRYINALAQCPMERNTAEACGTSLYTLFVRLRAAQGAEPLQLLQRKKVDFSRSDPSLFAFSNPHGYCGSFDYSPEAAQRNMLMTFRRMASNECEVDDQLIHECPSFMQKLYQNIQILHNETDHSKIQSYFARGHAFFVLSSSLQSSLARSRKPSSIEIKDGIDAKSENAVMSNTPLSDLDPSIHPRWFSVKTAHALGVLHLLAHIYGQAKVSKQGKRKLHIEDLKASLTSKLQSFINAFYSADIQRFLETPYCFCIDFEVGTDTLEITSFSGYVNNCVQKLQQRGLLGAQASEMSYVQQLEKHQPLILHRILALLLPPVGFCPLELVTGAIPQFSSYQLLQSMKSVETCASDFTVRNFAKAPVADAKRTKESARVAKLHTVARTSWCRAEISQVNLMLDHTEVLPQSLSRDASKLWMQSYKELPYPLSAIALLDLIIPKVPSYFVPMAHILCTLESEARSAIQMIGVQRLVEATSPTAFVQVLRFKLCTGMHAFVDKSEKPQANDSNRNTSQFDVLIRRLPPSKEPALASASDKALDAMLHINNARQKQVDRAERATVDDQDWAEYKNAPLTALVLACSMHISNFTFRTESGLTKVAYDQNQESKMSLSGGSLQYLMHHCPYRARGLAMRFPSILNFKRRLDYSGSVRKHRYLQTAAESAFSRDSDGRKSLSKFSLRSFQSENFPRVASFLESVLKQIAINFFTAFPHFSFAAHRAQDNMFFDLARRQQEDCASGAVASMGFGPYISRFSHNFERLKRNDASLSYCGAYRFAAFLILLRISFWSAWESLAAQLKLDTSDGGQGGTLNAKKFCATCYLLYPGVFPVRSINWKGICTCTPMQKEKLYMEGDQTRLTAAEKRRIANLEAEFTEFEFSMNKTLHSSIQETAGAIAKDIARVLQAKKDSNVFDNSEQKTPRAAWEEVHSCAKNVLKQTLHPLLASLDTAQPALQKESEVLLRTDGFSSAEKYIPGQRLIDALQKVNNRVTPSPTSSVASNRQTKEKVSGKVTEPKAAETTVSSAKPTSKSPEQKEQLKKDQPSSVSTEESSKTKFDKFLKVLKSVASESKEILVKEPVESTSARFAPSKRPNDNPPRLNVGQNKHSSLQEQSTQKSERPSSKPTQFENVNENRAHNEKSKETSSTENAVPRKIINTFAMDRKQPFNHKSLPKNESRTRPQSRPAIRGNRIRLTNQHLAASQPSDSPREELPVLQKYIFHCGSLVSSLGFEAQRIAILHWAMKQMVTVDSLTRNDLKEGCFPEKGMREGSPAFSIRIVANDAKGAEFNPVQSSAFAVFSSTESIRKEMPDAHAAFLKKFYFDDIEYFFRCHERLFVTASESAFKAQAAKDVPWYTCSSQAPIPSTRRQWVCIPPKSPGRTEQVLNISYFYYVLQTFVPVGAAISVSALLPFFHGISEVQFKYFFASKKILGHLFFGIESGKVSTDDTAKKDSSKFDIIIRRAVTSLPPFLNNADAFGSKIPALCFGKRSQALELTEPKLPEIKTLTGIPNVLLAHRSSLTTALSLLDTLLPHIPGYLTPLSEVVHAATMRTSNCADITRVYRFTRSIRLGLASCKEIVAHVNRYQQKFDPFRNTLTEDQTLNRLSYGSEQLLVEIQRCGLFRLAGLIEYFDDTKYINPSIPNLQIVPISYYPQWIDPKGAVQHARRPSSDYLVSKRMKPPGPNGAQIGAFDAHFSPTNYDGYAIVPVRIAEIAICICHMYWSTKAPAAGGYDASWYLSVGAMLDILPECLREWLLHECCVDPQWLFDSYPLLFEPCPEEVDTDLPTSSEEVHALYQTKRYRSRVADHLNVSELNDLFVSLKTFLSACDDHLKTIKGLKVSTKRFVEGQSPIPYKDGEEPDEPVETLYLLDDAFLPDAPSAPIPKDHAPGYISIAVPVRCKHFSKVFALASLYRNFAECRGKRDCAVIMSFAGVHWQPSVRINAEEKVEALIADYVESKPASLPSQTETLTSGGRSSESIVDFTPCSISSYLNPKPENIDLSQWTLQQSAVTTIRDESISKSLPSGHQLQTQLIEHHTKLRMVAWLYRTLMSTAGVSVSDKAKIIKSVQHRGAKLQLTFATTAGFLKKHCTPPVDLSQFLDTHAHYHGDLRKLAAEHPAFFYVCEETGEMHPVVPNMKDPTYLDILIDEVLPPCGWINRRFVHELLLPLVKPSDMARSIETSCRWKAFASIEVQKDADVIEQSDTADRNTNKALLTYAFSTQASMERSSGQPFVYGEDNGDFKKQWLSRATWRSQQRIFSPKLASITSFNQETKLQKTETISEAIELTPTKNTSVSLPKKAKPIALQTCCLPLIRCLPLIDSFFAALPKYFVPLSALLQCVPADLQDFIKRFGFRDFLQAVVVSSMGLERPCECIAIKAVTVFDNDAFHDVLFIRRSHAVAMHSVPDATMEYPGFGDLVKAVMRISLHMSERFGDAWVSYATLLENLPKEMRDWLGFSCPYTFPALCRLFPRLISSVLGDERGRIDTNHIDAKPIVWYRSVVAWQYASLNDAMEDAQRAADHMMLTPPSTQCGLNALCLDGSDMPMHRYALPISVQSSSTQVTAKAHDFGETLPLRPPVIEFSSYFVSFIGKNSIHDGTLHVPSTEMLAEASKSWVHAHVKGVIGVPQIIETSVAQRLPAYTWTSASGRAMDASVLLGNYIAHLKRQVPTTPQKAKVSASAVKQRELAQSLTEYDDDEDFSVTEPEEPEGEIESPISLASLVLMEPFVFFSEKLANRVIESTASDSGE